MSNLKNTRYQPLKTQNSPLTTHPHERGITCVWRETVEAVGVSTKSQRDFERFSLFC